MVCIVKLCRPYMDLPKPKPGSLPRQKKRDLQPLPPRSGPSSAQTMFPDFLSDAERALLSAPRPSRASDTRGDSHSRLQAARRKVEILAAAVRDEAFDDWVRRELEPARDPREWTVARTLYESYVSIAATYGGSRAARRNSRLELATETRWGKMMGSLFSKKRRESGWYYPLRVKNVRAGE